MLYFAITLSSSEPVSHLLMPSQKYSQKSYRYHDANCGELSLAIPSQPTPFTQPTKTALNDPPLWRDNTVF